MSVEEKIYPSLTTIVLDCSFSDYDYLLIYLAAATLKTWRYRYTAYANV